MTALQDFTKARKSGLVGTPTPSPYTPPVSAPTSVPITSSGGSSSLRDFANSRKSVSEPKTELQKFVKEKNKGSTLRWVGKQLMKPVGVVATVAEQTGKAIGGGDFGEITAIPKLAGQVLTGDRERSFSDIWKEGLSGSPVAGTIIGTVIDIAADPLNAVGGGLLKLGRLASTVSKVTKAGGKIEAGSKLALEIAESGKTIEQLNAIAKMTKAEQAAEGARAFLKVGNKPVLSQRASENIYKATGKVGGAIAKAPVISKGRSLFSTSTGNKDADLVIRHFRDQGEYMKANAVEEAIEINKELKKFSKPEEMIQVSDYLEKGIKPANAKLEEIATRLKTIYESKYRKA